MRAALLVIPLCALTGSLALPQTISGSSISLPGVDLSPADQTACIQSCSQSVANNRPDALDACLDATGKSAPNCLCNDATLSAEMQKCFGARCPPLQGRCAAILGGSSSISGTGLSSTGSPGTPGTGNQSSGSTVSFPGVQLPAAQQTACVQSCSEDVADNEPDALDACLSATGNSAANCLCTDATLAAEMQKCFASRCAPLQGHCAALDADGGIFIAGTSGSSGGGAPGTTASTGSSSPGTASGGTSEPGSAGAGTPGSAGAGTPGGSADGAAGASGSSSDNGAGGSSPGTSAPGAQPAPESGVPASPGGTSPSAAEASPSTPSSAAADDVNPGAADPDNSAGVNGAMPLFLVLSLAFAVFL